ncbi:MAG: Ig-like domain-containing protein [Xanthomonadales bacterium]|nr:Ig-like domain-containing protein [Xanthomonadales bacterium]
MFKVLFLIMLVVNSAALAAAPKLNAPDLAGNNPAIVIQAADTSPVALVPRADINDPIDWQSRIQNATGSETTVSTLAEFNSAAAAAAAQAGDVILIADGVYSWYRLRISSNGTKENPIIYTALNPGKVTFEEIPYLFDITGSWNIIGGFTLDNIGTQDDLNDPTDRNEFVFRVDGSDNRLTDNIINESGNHRGGKGALEILGGGDRTRFDNNTVIRGKGFIRVVVTNPSSFAQDVRIDHNVFDTAFFARYDNGIQASVTIMQVGQADFSPDGRGLEVRTVFEYNTIDNFYGRTQQMISNKSSHNIYRYNNFIDSVGGIGLREGDHNQVYGNYWGDGGSPRTQLQTVSVFIKGQYNIVANNVFDMPRARGAISESTWGWRKFRDGVQLTPRTGNNLFANNTIIATHSSEPAIKLAFRAGNFDVPGAEEFPIEGSVYVNNIIMGEARKLFSYRSGWCNSCVITDNLYRPTAGNALGEGFDSDQNSSQGNPRLDSNYSPTANSLLLINKGNPMVLNSVNVGYLGPNRRLGSAPEIGAIEFLEAGGNNDPIANPDSASVNENGTVVLDVLANDSDPDAADRPNLYVSAVTQGNNGAVTTNGSSVTYTPDTGFSGTDEFIYTLNDDNGGTNTALVTVSVIALGGTGSIFSDGFEIAGGVQPGTAILIDTFTGSAELVDHSPDTNMGGGVWKTSAGTGRVLINTDGANDNLQIRYDSGYSAAIDVGVTNQRLQVDVTAGGSTRKPLIMINREALTHASGGNDLLIEGESYAAQLDIAGNVVNLLQLSSNGSSTVLASAPRSLNASSTYTVELSRFGDSLTISVNGTSLIAHTLTGTPLSNTGVALGWDANTSGGRFDNLSVYELSDAP